MRPDQLATLAAAAEDFVLAGLPGRSGDILGQMDRIRQAAARARIEMQEETMTYDVADQLDKKEERR